MRELVSSASKEKPIIALIDLDVSRGGMSLDEVKTQFVEADVLATKWGFYGYEKASSGAEYQESYSWPGGTELHEHLIGEHEPIEWNRIGHFQEYDGEPQTHTPATLVLRTLLTRLDTLTLNAAASPCA